jgi:transposase-like protein
LKTLSELIEEVNNIAEVCRQLDIPRQTLERWRNLKSKPSRGMVALMATKGIDVTEFLDKPKNGL